jgi:6-phospho-beta-glucosidase
LIQQVKAYEELAVEAAVRRDRASAILALTAHPLVRSARIAAQAVEDLGL